jgi:tRNA wybutosine-synthesizing protein 2
MCPEGVADHVNLGLIPSSEDGWRGACGALKRRTGGMLHVHGNVDLKMDCGGGGCGTLNGEDNDYDHWANYVCSRIQEIFTELYPDETWSVELEAVVKVKSFAPHVDHLVADILCTPSQ